MKKIDTVILNPGILSKMLLENQKFDAKHSVKYVYTKLSSMKDFELELNAAKLIIIDDLDSPGSVFPFIDDTETVIKYRLP